MFLYSVYDPNSHRMRLFCDASLYMAFIWPGAFRFDASRLLAVMQAIAIHSLQEQELEKHTGLFRELVSHPALLACFCMISSTIHHDSLTFSEIASNWSNWFSLIEPYPGFLCWQRETEGRTNYDLWSTAEALSFSTFLKISKDMFFYFFFFFFFF